MSVLRRVLLAVGSNPLVERQMTTRALARRIALRFIAGETLEDGLTAVRAEAAGGRTATLDFLGEAVTSATAARAAQGTILDAVTRITADALPSGLSIKPTQMGLRFDPDLTSELLGEIAGKAAADDQHVTLDMEGSDVTEATVALCERLRAAGHANVGCALQAYLRRTEDDVERLTAAGASIRLTKGAYAEPPDIAFPTRREVDLSYVRSADWLLANGHYPRIATHDEALIERAKRTAIRLGRSPEDFEFQMLYGVRRELQGRLIHAGWQLRVYIPFGTQWYPYFLRRIAERPANVVFFLRALAGS